MSRMFVSARYNCFGRAAVRPENLKQPPFSESGSAANSDGASKRAGQYQSMVPSVPTRATVLRVCFSSMA